QHLLKTALHLDAPAAIRYPRGSGVGVEMDQVWECLPLGSWEVLQEGNDGVVLAVGSCVYPAWEAIKELVQEYPDRPVALVNCRYIKPMDEKLLRECLQKQPFVMTVEENSMIGGFGSAVARFQADSDLTGTRLSIHGLPDHFIEQGSLPQLRQKYGLDASGIKTRILNLMR
ncbi:MAG: transketolase C-terminal domain-containing protein, partial [Pseudomonadota bacterium]|nr:transketolase C-terminal domain-containing protein [Pseudomonadota bacterium]